MRTLKRFAALLLAAILTFTLSSAAFAAVDDTGFSDVDAGAWYADAAVYCRDNGLMSGTSATTFSPNGVMTRAMLATVLYRAAGSPAVSGGASFSDVAPTAYYADAAAWASQEGIVSGYGNGRFGSNDPVTREQIAAIFWRHAGSPAAGSDEGYTDSDDIASYARGAVAWAHSAGIMSGVANGRFDPKGTVTRAQTAVILMRYLERSPITPPAGEDTDHNVLVAYFSRYGNTNYETDVDATTSASIVVQDGEQVGTTELVAHMIQAQTSGDLFLIETAEPYPANFQDVVDQNHQELANGTRPALANTIDLSAYDVIFVGYPVWASSVPTPVLSFLEGQDLTGKTVIPFCTHDGYGAGGSYAEIASSCPDVVVENGLAVESSHASSAQDSVRSWLDGLDLLTGADSTAKGETSIHITIGDTELEGILYDSDMARQFIAQLPQTISMSNYGGREVYGGIDQEITVEGAGQLRFENGDITYCPSNNTAAIFYAQTDRPNLTMEVYPIGKVTSDLSIFPSLPSRVEITFAVTQ